MAALSKLAPADRELTAAETAEVVAAALPPTDYRGQRVLLIVPDSTRTAPVGLMFRTIHQQIGGVTKALDVLVALGTHPAMSEAAICQRLEITAAERKDHYGAVQFHNHAWDNPAALTQVGTIPADEIRTLSGGLFAMDVPVEINKLVFDYDQVIIVGPVFPHEVVGFSGGNKYLFPGVGGPAILNFFHWLAAIITNPMIIGNKWTPVRRVVDRAGALVNLDKRCFSLVIEGKAFKGLFFGTPETSWDGASDLSAKLNILRKPRAFHTILSCCPPMYDDLWTGGKCMYKLEPVLADGGRLIIHAPHITEVSVTHGRLLEEIGYHCRDYFLNQWDHFKHHPWGVLAHSTHVKGIGTFENGIETPRAEVILASQLSRDLCRQINLGWQDPGGIRVEDFANREEEGVLVVPKAGEMLYQLESPPAWAGGK